MKQAIVLGAAFSLLLLAGGVTAETEPPDQAVLKERLVKLENQSWEAWKNRDAKFFQDFLSDDHAEVGFSGVATKADVVAFVGSPVCQVKTYTVDHFEMKLLDKNTALLTYRAEQDTTCNGKAVPSPCWVSSLYMKRGERWVNVLYQQSQVAK
jgi:hypothetical protein